MRAVILAAGRGGRLKGVVGDRPKCLALVGDCTLVERQIRSIRACGIDSIAVVVGYRADEVTAVCGSGVEIVHNSRWATTNSLYSLWLARDLLAEGFLVLNCDVLFHEQLLRDLLTARYDDALLFAARRPNENYSEEEMKVTVRAGRVTAIGKDLPDADADGENMGIARFGASGALALVDHLSAIVAGGGFREWLPRGFERFCRVRPLHAIESRGYPWIEIDFPEDYWRACSDVLPALGDSDARRASPSSTLTAATGRRSRRSLHV